MSVNKVILIGRLGADPEKLVTGTGRTVARFTLATSEQWKDQAGQKQEKTEWHKIVVWGPLAERCSEHLGKGRQVYIEGRLQTRQWEDKEGAKRYTTEVVAQRVQYLSPRTDGQGRGNTYEAAESNSVNETPAFDMDAGPDDVPF